MLEFMLPSAASILSLSALALVWGLVLSFAKMKLKVEKDPVAEPILQSGIAMTARVMCRGGIRKTASKFFYEGPKSCKAANGIMDGFKVCEHACLGFGDCYNVCSVGAITMAGTRLPVIDNDKCTGCGNCVAECSKHIIKLVKKGALVYIMCSNNEKPEVMKLGCTVGCTGCNLCVKACTEAFKDNPDIDSVITVNAFLVDIDYAKCTNCLKCAEVCPVPVINPLSAARKFKKKKKLGRY
jgi:Na+-translocating ferredoxin:NAD+ oxidoreductase RNF subunit RnfB